MGYIEGLVALWRSEDIARRSYFCFKSTDKIIRGSIKPNVIYVFSKGIRKGAYGCNSYGNVGIDTEVTFVLYYYSSSDQGSSRRFMKLTATCGKRFDLCITVALVISLMEW